MRAARLSIEYSGLSTATGDLDTLVVDDTAGDSGDAAGDDRRPLNPQFRRRVQMKISPLICALGLVASTSGEAQAASIDFDDGISGDAVGSFYSGLGINLTSAFWDGFESPLESSVGAGGLKIKSRGSDYQPKIDSPIAATFSALASSVRCCRPQATAACSRRRVPGTCASGPKAPAIAIETGQHLRFDPA